MKGPLKALVKGSSKRNLRATFARAAAELDELAGFWIGRERPRPEEAARRSGWKPDRSDEYCGLCGSTVGPGEASKSGCGSCRRRTLLDTDRIVRLGAYHGPLREWVRDVKYRRWSAMGEYLGRELGGVLAGLNEIERERAVVIPVPMPWTRRLLRGIDHTEIIARAVAGVLDAPLARVLARRHGVPQTQLPRSERRRNAQRGMFRRFRFGGWPLQELDLVVVDDVRTTGATMQAAVRRLRPLRPRRIFGAVIAVSGDTARRQREDHHPQKVTLRDRTNRVTQS